MADESHKDDEIGVICTVCFCEIRKSVRWILAHTQLECVNCGAIIDLENKDLDLPDADRRRGSDS